MDISKKEMELAQQVELTANEVASVELAEMQLALVGGGVTVDIFG